VPTWDVHEAAWHNRAQADAARTRAAEENAEAHQLVQMADREDARAELARAAAQYEPDVDERDRTLAEVEQRDATAGYMRVGGRSLNPPRKGRRFSSN